MTARRAAGLAAVLLAAQAALGVSFALRAAPVWDEVPTFGQGLHLLRTGRWDFPGSLNHPPLTSYLQSLPLLWAGGVDDAAFASREPPSDARMRLLWRGFYDVGRGQALYAAAAERIGVRRLTFLVRLPTLVLGLLGSLLLWRWARALHGEAGGLVALAVWVLNPSLLGHGALATTDAALAVFAIATGLAFERAWARPGAGRAALCGLALGLALLTKYTALLLLVPLAGLLAVEVARSEARARTARRALALLAAMLAVAGAVVVAGYQGRPLAFLEGVQWQAINVRHGQTGMALGRLSRHGWWWFYPFVLAVKTPLSALLLAALGALCWVRREGLGRRLLFATVPFGFFLAFFLLRQLPVGVRYLLPFYPALALAAGAALPERASRRTRAAAVALLAANALELASVHPHELSFFNLASGGLRSGHRLLADSNVDWGQDLSELGPYLAARGLDRIQLGYFGTADPAWYGIAYDALPSMYLANRTSGPREWPPRGLVAVSATCYWGLCDAGPQWQGRNPYAFLHGRTPRDVVGGSILVFELP